MAIKGTSYTSGHGFKLGNVPGISMKGTPSRSSMPQPSLALKLAKRMGLFNGEVMSGLPSGGVRTKASLPTHPTNPGIRGFAGSSSGNGARNKPAS